jgi:hypothetical protein
MAGKLPRGFQPVFRYKFVNGSVRSEKILNEKLWKQRGVVYARVCKGRVVYVGKADSTLRARIMWHIRFFPKSRKALPYRKYAEGKTITIFAYRPKPIQLFGMRVGDSSVYRTVCWMSWRFIPMAT